MKFLKSLLTLAALTIGNTNALALPRSNAPNFKGVNAVVDGKFKTVSLSDYKDKYLVIVFYPFDFTYVCPTELISFSDNL